jgi:hypothetical protein
MEASSSTVLGHDVGQAKIRDVFIHDISQNRSSDEDAIIEIVSLKALRKMSFDDTIGETTQYSKTLHCNMKVGFVSHTGMTAVQRIIKIAYAKLEVFSNQEVELTVNEIYMTVLKGRRTATIAFYKADETKDKEPVKKKPLIWKNVKVIPYASEAEFVLGYAAGAHRMQKKYFKGAIFRQTSNNFFVRQFDAFVDRGIPSKIYFANGYMDDIPYDIEVELNKKNKQPDKLQIFTFLKKSSKSQPTTTPQKAFLRLEEVQMGQVPVIESVQELIEKINESTKTQNFQLSMHFKRPPDCPQGVILHAWSRGQGPQKGPKLLPAEIYYAVPMEVEIAFPGGNAPTQRFDYLFLQAKPIPVIPVELMETLDPLNKHTPRTVEEARARNMYETYLYALAFRYFIKAAMNKDSPHYLEASAKLKEILETGDLYNNLPVSSSYLISSKHRWQFRQKHLNARTIPYIDVMCNPKDPTPYAVNFEKMPYVKDPQSQKGFKKVSDDNYNRKAKNASNRVEKNASVPLFLVG